MASSSSDNGEECVYNFVDKPSEDYFCPVTLELLTDPLQTNSCCGQHLSRTAVEILQAQQKPCPMCMKTSPLKAVEDLFFKRRVMELKVYCSNKPRCGWVGELSSLAEHLKLGALEGQCQYVDVQCPLECGMCIQRHDITEHEMRQCVNRLFTCDYCNNFKSNHEGDLTDHQQKCPHFPEICPNNCTKKRIPRSQMRLHLKEKCRLQEIECKYSHAGCGGKIVRHKMREHLKSRRDRHLEMVSAKCKRLENELSIYMQMSRMLLTPEFTITNYGTMFSTGIDWMSPAFYTHAGGYKLCLVVRPIGWGRGKDTHVSVSVHIIKGEFDDYLQWPFKGEIAFKLVNQKDGGKDREGVIRADGFQRVIEIYTPRGQGLGFSTFISHDKLHKPEDGNEFLKYDTLKFKVITCRCK